MADCDNAHGKDQSCALDVFAQRGNKLKGHRVAFVGLSALGLFLAWHKGSSLSKQFLLNILVPTRVLKACCSVIWFVWHFVTFISIASLKSEL